MSGEIRDGWARQAAIEARQVDDAWERIETWLHRNAPATAALLRPGATDDELAAFERELGVRIPAGLKALWRRCPGMTAVDGVGADFLLGRWAPMTFDAVLETYRMQMGMRVTMDEYVSWRPSWIPFASFGAHDTLYGLCLDAETGKIWKWTEIAERTLVHPSLSVYLEDMADALDLPDLTPGAPPRVREGALVWA
ncbi:MULTISPECIES: SMI1/KNR4 family protein [unclassified Streptomyces]|uniref:SMI1/KNR4 family protein n=1 Tax=unclassified Streptomyces TaxID=2593676 RepID=UPI000DB9FCDE|nr:MULTISPECIES: SMI1/KNR4 family protein [unclassified Streptomyces]MYT69620.1 SMI1/KNR4 family protein [Streptomyces sp. SID8367]RAJ74169.1 cell wall assembly regulator SMI1 [Streptomyces sp. PsTaAH-137]